MRNIALTAPYMHNGTFATLEDVVDFYSEGGGNAQGLADIVPFVFGFDLTDQEKLDLIAFLVALTDESGLAAFPETVPSGLPIIGPLDNPAREWVAATNLDSTAQQPAARDPMTIRVTAGETVQDAVDRAQPGDTVEIPLLPTMNALSWTSTA